MKSALFMAFGGLVVFAIVAGLGISAAVLLTFLGAAAAAGFVALMLCYAIAKDGSGTVLVVVLSIAISQYVTWLWLKREKRRMQER